jgi:glycosyltransferase involved in cell wall biosynthesis
VAANKARPGRGPASLDVVVCTYNRAAGLDRTLGALARQQRPASLQWSVLVVDNASEDETSRIVQAWIERSALPGLRTVVEWTQGLSHARARGFHETTADWIAYVDDDNLLADDWLSGMADAIGRKPDAGGFGGRVILDWAEAPPSYLQQLGWCFAEQDHGLEMREIDNLVGAGMVLRRAALLDSGWPEHLLLEDRVGTKLLSGGDVEMVQRVRLAGHQLWYTPRPVLKHVIGAERMRREYVCRLAFGLGAGAARVSAVCCTADRLAWRHQARRETRRHAAYALYLFRRSLLARVDLTPAVVQAAFAAGYFSGVRSVGRLPLNGQQRLIGSAMRLRRRT